MSKVDKIFDPHHSPHLIREDYYDARIKGTALTTRVMNRAQI